MASEILYDITTASNAVNSLSNFVDIYQEDILKYIALKKQQYSADDFLEYFKIEEDSLLEKQILLTSLHVVTNDDNCKSIENYGLRNLRESIVLNTPLGLYLKNKGIKIDIKNRDVSYNGKHYDMSKDYDGMDSKEKGEFMVKYKLYKDYQINGFFSVKNALKYGGSVNKRPEILYNLSDMLNNINIENDWIINKRNKCYVIKYKADISQFADCNFNISDYDCQLDKENIEVQKRKDIINKTLSVISNDIFYNFVSEIYSYMSFDASIPYEDIISIYSDEEYIREFNIKI